MKNGSNIRNIGIKPFKIVNFSSFLFCPKFLLILSEVCQNLVRNFLSENYCIITVTSPDPDPNHRSEVSLRRAKIVRIFGVENCLSRIFNCCQTDKVD